jgi:hypothetical protein
MAILYPVIMKYEEVYAFSWSYLGHRIFHGHSKNRNWNRNHDSAGIMAGIVKKKNTAELNCLREYFYQTTDHLLSNSTEQSPWNTSSSSRAKQLKLTTLFLVLRLRNVGWTYTSTPPPPCITWCLVKAPGTILPILFLSEKTKG